MGRGRDRSILIAGVTAFVSASIMIIAPANVGAAAGPSGLCAAIPKQVSVRLVVTPRSLAAGQRIHYRIDNSAGPTITYGPGYSIQECLDGVWVLAPFSPAGAARVKIAQRPSHGRWEVASIPATAGPGEYRIRKPVSDEKGGRWLYAGFEIVPQGV